MTARIRVFLVPAALLIAAGAVTAQRGGGGGRSSTAAPVRSEYDSATYGLKFTVPTGLELYTDEEPGRYEKILVSGRAIYLINSDQRDASIVAKVSADVSEADLKGLKGVLESNPPQAKLPGYKKIAVSEIMIGAAADKPAVEYIFSEKNDKMTATVRQVMFLHQGRGFTFICTAPERQFGSYNKRFFDPLFARMEFR
jgi:hypothetical protein